MTRIYPPRVHLKTGERNGQAFVLCKREYSAFTEKVEEVTCKICLMKIGVIKK